MSDPLSPDDALAVLNRYAGAYKKTARATREMVIDQGRVVSEVYAACEVAGVTAARWFRQHWDVADNTARNWMRVYENRDRLPEKIAPSTVYFLFSPSISESQEPARDYLLALMADGVRLTDALVKKVMRDADLSESIALVAGHLRRRIAVDKMKPKDVLNEMDAIAEVANRWRTEGLAFSPDFTAEVGMVAARRKAEADALHEYVPVTLYVVGGRAMFVALETSAALLDFDGQNMMVLARKAA